MPMLASYEEIDNLSPVDPRFRQASQFHMLFKEHHGPGANLLDTRLFWMCHADGFLMTLVSLKVLVLRIRRWRSMGATCSVWSPMVRDRARPRPPALPRPSAQPLRTIGRRIHHPGNFTKISQTAGRHANVEC